MSEINSAGMAEIIKAARSGHVPQILDVGVLVGVKAPVLLVPAVDGSIGMHQLKNTIDAYRDRPERYSGMATLDDLSSFVAHANRFKDADSAIFISGDPARPSFLSMLDYSEARNAAGPVGGGETKLMPVEDAAPRFGKHRGSYVPVFSDEWKAWTGASGKPMTQEQFAALIQGRARDIFDVFENDVETARLGELASWFAKRFARGIPAHEFYGSAERMLECSEGLTATIEETIADQTKMGATGAVKITFGSQAKTAVDIPAAIVIEVPVFRGGDLWQLPVRLRYTVRQHGDTKRAEWRIEVFGAERTIADVVKDMGETVRKATALPVFVGAPES